MNYMVEVGLSEELLELKCFESRFLDHNKLW